jgi:hypothetical protein
MVEFQKVMQEDLFNTSSSEFGAIIETIISGILRQQPGKSKSEEVYLTIFWL